MKECEWRIEQKKKKKKRGKEGFLNALVTSIMKNPITPIRKHANELKDHEKTVRTAIKQNLSLDLYPLDYAIWGILEQKTNVTSYPNIGSRNTAIEGEWKTMFEEFILNACKSFRRRVDLIIKKKNGGHTE